MLAARIPPHCARSKRRWSRSAASSRSPSLICGCSITSSLHTYLADQFEQDYLPSERESDQKELVALGLIKPTDNLVQIQLDLLSDQVVGVYDSESKSMFLLADQGNQTFGPAERMTYAHEFNHALQDQHFDLNKIAPKHPDSNDHSLAVHAVIEGDAVMLQTLWAQANLSQDELIQLARGAGGSGDSLARVPLVVRTELLFPYVDGFNFVRQAYRQASNSYAAVDDLLRNPPESTAQILHPDKYLNQVHPVPVQLPGLAAALGPDWRQVGSGVLGELDTRTLLEQWGTNHSDAMRVASGLERRSVATRREGRPLGHRRQVDLGDPGRGKRILQLLRARPALSLRFGDDRGVVRDPPGAHHAGGGHRPAPAGQRRAHRHRVRSRYCQRDRRRRHRFRSLTSISSGLHETTSSG